MATFASLANLVKPFVFNVPDDLIAWHFVQVAREFCAQTRWLRESVYVPVTAAANPTFVLSASDPASFEIIEVKAVEWEGEPLDPKLQEEVADEVFGFYYIEPPATLKLSWTPDEDSTDVLQVRQILQILESVTAIPDVLARRWSRGLAAGVMSRLLVTADAPWANPPLAAVHEKKWLADLGTAQVQADREHTRQGFRVVSYS